MQPFAADLFGAPPIGSPQWWKQPERFDISSDPDTATAQTIQVMCSHIKVGAADRLVQESAGRAAQQFSQHDGAADLAAAAWYWCKTYIRFVHHESLLRRHLGESGHLQGLISPDALLRMDRPEGDCAIFTDCLCSFLRVYGVPYEIVTVAVNPEEPEIYSHVFAYAVLEDGTRLALDASHGTHPGWQVPSAAVTKRQAWDADGNRVADRGARFGGLGNYGLRGGLGSMVCLDQNDTSSCYEDGGAADSSVNLCALYPGACATPGLTPVVVGSQSGFTVPPQNTAAFAALAAQLVKGGFTLAELNAMQPGTVINPSGQIIRQSPGYAVTSGGQVAGSVVSSLTGSMFPWVIGAAVIGLGLAFAGGRGR